MRRREFITLVGGAAATWPLAARAQEQMKRIGVLMARAENDPNGEAFASAFREGLRKLGWTEGRNVQIDMLWTRPGDAESMRRSAKELVALQPDLILSAATPSTATLLQQTRTIPIIFATASDPVGSGFVQVFRGPAETSPVSAILTQQLPASGWSCSRRLRRTSPGSPCCSTRQRHPILKFT